MGKMTQVEQFSKGDGYVEESYCPSDAQVQEMIGKVKSRANAGLLPHHDQLIHKHRHGEKCDEQEHVRMEWQ